MAPDVVTYKLDRGDGSSGDGKLHLKLRGPREVDLLSRLYACGYGEEYRQISKCWFDLVILTSGLLGMQKVYYSAWKP